MRAGLPPRCEWVEPPPIRTGREAGWLKPKCVECVEREKEWLIIDTDRKAKSSKHLKINDVLIWVVIRHG